MNKIKHVIKLLCPSFFIRFFSKIQRSLDDKRRHGMAVKEIFTEIYDKKLWGGPEKFYPGSGSVKFLCLDIIDDELPSGDIAFLRQVLQHLSNEQILKILPKLKQYKIVFITESCPTPNPDIMPNKNMAVGSAIRLYRNSGVYLDKMPFNLPKDSLELFLEVPGSGMGKGFDQGIIRTYKLEPSKI